MPRTVDSSKTPKAVAIRIPDGVCKTPTPAGAIVPHLLVHEGLRQALERKISQARSGPANLSITDNKHGIIVHQTRKGVLSARVHFMFLDAPPEVTTALVKYLINWDAESDAILGDFILANGNKLRKRPSKLVTKGSVYDLQAIFQELNQKYFNGTCNAHITWGQKSNRKRTKKRTTIRLGSYAYLEKLIRIHPALDLAWVPKYFITSVIYHEMLHHMIPSARGYSSKNMRAPRVLHPPEFLEKEKLFRDHERAMEWERRNIERLLRVS